MDSDHKAWHDYHIQHKNDYGEGYSDLMSGVKTWSPHNLHHRLVYFAKNFKPLRFVNGSVLSGFYDTAKLDVMKVWFFSSSVRPSNDYPIIATLADQTPEQEKCRTFGFCDLAYLRTWSIKGEGKTCFSNLFHVISYSTQTVGQKKACA